MPSILSDLYNGRCRPFARSYSAEYRSRLSAVCEAEERFMQKLPEELRSEFRQYVSVSAELSSVGGEEDFIEGFRLGVRLMAEAAKTE